MALSFMLDSAPAAGLVSVGDCRPQTSSAARIAMKESPPPPVAHGSNGDSRSQLDSPSDLNSSRLSPSPNAVAAAAAAAAALSGLPLLPPHLLRATPASLLAASRRAALMALPPGLTPPQLSDPSTGVVPVSLHATLASGPALFPYAPRALFDWRNGDTGKQALAPAPSPPVAHAAPVNKKRSNGRIVRGGAKKAAKVEAESTTIDLGPTPVTSLPSPPTSGSSPPSNSSSEGSSGDRGRKGSSSAIPASTTTPAVSSAGNVQGDAGRDKVFVCGICYRSFGYKHVLQNHERTHTGEKPFECRECHKRFTRDHHLKTHMRLHTGEKPYHCTHCDRQFVQVANLRRHLRVHTGERPYACELCSSRFSDSNQLKAHTLIHKGEKPFECGRCGGRFRRRHHLLHHKCPRGGEGEVIEEEEDEDEDEEEVISGRRRRRTPRATICSSSPDDLEEEEDEEDASSGKCPEDEEDDDDLAGDDDRGDDAMDEDVSAMKRLLKKRERKSRDIRRVIRMPKSEAEPASQPPPEPMPEQTEPEDLSIRRSTPERHSPDNPFVSWPSSSSGSPPSAPVAHIGKVSPRSDGEDERMEMEMEKSEESILASLPNDRKPAGSAFLEPAHRRSGLKFRRNLYALHPLHHVRHQQNGSAPVS